MEVGSLKKDLDWLFMHNRRLVPVFCARYLGAGGAGVRRACLSLVRKMVHYAPAPLLRTLSTRATAALLTQLVAAVIDNLVSHKLCSCHM